MRALARKHGLALVADACHALGGSYHGAPVGSLADLSTFSLHPVKPITTGEGGVITTNNAAYAARMRQFRGHGITGDFRAREKQGAWAYEMTTLGYNFRLSDLQCALGVRQLRKLPAWIRRRQEIAAHYDAAFADDPAVTPLARAPRISHGYHLYTVRVRGDRAAHFRALRSEKIGVNVHYMPVYLHPFYRERGYAPGLCPVAEAAYERILTLPIFPRMSDEDTGDVIRAVRKVTATYP